MNPSTITGRINTKALELLGQYPEGLRWTDLALKIKASDSSFHPKTVNGSIWKLVEKFPGMVYKPSKGIFRLVKYRTEKASKFDDDTLRIDAKKPKTIDEYVASVPNSAQAKFKQLRDLVLNQLPKANEVMSYGVIGYKIDEKRARVFISGWKDHVAMYPIPKSEYLRSELRPYIKGKGTLWFPLDQPLPADIIKKSIMDLVT